jgi:preprotein translocase subunit YajC
MNVILLGSLLAQNTVPDPKAQMLQMVGLLVLMGVMFYFAIFRPQQKKTKEHETLMKALKAGDKVVTNSGILGVVVSIKDKTVTLRSADAKFEILKGSISEVVEKAESSSS